MSNLRRARLRQRSSSDHERARRLAAERLYETPGAEETSWLAAHLDDCEPCRAIAIEYEEQHLALRGLQAPEPPRDLWARTAAALDAEDRRAAGRYPGGRLSGVSRAPLVPYGALAGVLVVAVVIGSSLLAGGTTVMPPGESAAPSTGLPTLLAAPTPVAVAAAEVAWFTPQDDGTYALNIAAVDHVCPDAAKPDCAPIDGSARQSLRLTAAPRAVVRSPQTSQTSQIVVVDAATASTGGSIYVVPVAAPLAPGATASPPGPVETPFAIATAPLTPEPSVAPTEPVLVATPDAGTPTPVVDATPSPEPATSPEPVASPEPSASGGPSESPGPSASVEPGGPIAIISDVIVVGETAAYSPDGSQFAFTARPGDGSQGPDIYVWRVGDLLAHPVTSDHASVFSSWLGSFVLGSRAVPDPLPATTDPFSGLVPSDGTSGPPASPADQSADQSTEPSSGPSTDASIAPSPDQPAGPLETIDPGASVEPGQSGIPEATLVVPTAQPVSFVIDPPTGIATELAVPAWRPVVDPTGRYVVFWSGTLGLDQASSAWGPLVGQLQIAPWTALLPVIPPGSPAIPFDPFDPFATPAPLATDGVGSPLPTPFGEPIAVPTPEPPVTPEPLPTPTVEPTPIPTAVALSSPDAMAPGSSVALPGTETPMPTPLPTPFTPLVAPEPLPVSSGTADRSILDWDIRWDPSGTHLAVWVADPAVPGLGRLSLLTIDGPTGRVDLARSLLVDAPALAGFSVADGRIAWATPPGQDGDGSRLFILAWDAGGSGRIDSQPAMSGSVVVVR